MNIIKKELLSLLLILFSGVIILLLLALLNFTIEYLFSLELIGWITMGYITICAILFYLHSHFSNRASKIFLSIWVFPLRLAGGLVGISVPFVVLQVHLMYYLIFSLSLPGIFYLIDRQFMLSEIAISTYTYVILTFSVIIATTFNKQLKHLVYLLSPFRIYYSKKLKKYKFKELTDYLISENNIRFLIYFGYFSYLILFNIFNLENRTLHNDVIMDKAILQSFITFVAFDSVLRNFKSLEFRPSEMLRKIVQSITGSDSRK